MADVSLILLPYPEKERQDYQVHQLGYWIGRHAASLRLDVD
jgi:hypothetical protein